uniref:Hypoxia-inducible factor 1 n=1 Tax=Cephalodiscus hodgsoni TaxID=560606 RepID=A0AA96HCC9_9BILA|nr:hypoxia-inducible factor 1 [Cephalodiscus hodgsoni]
MKTEIRTKSKRRNSEKRKERSRNAARSRRGKETDLFYELAQELPVSCSVCSQLDKAGIMRMVLSYLKIRNLFSDCDVERALKQLSKDTVAEESYLKALDGFLVVLTQEGSIAYVSDNVSRYLGLKQVDLTGSSLYEYSHPCDHDEVRDELETKNDRHAGSHKAAHSFLVRMKCTLQPNGKKVNLKAAAYKAIHFRGHSVMAHADQSQAGHEELYTVLVGEPIPHPANIEVPLDSKTFVTKHNLDMTFTYCDERVKDLLGYDPEELLGRSVYKFQHGLDTNHLKKTFHQRK